MIHHRFVLETYVAVANELEERVRGLSVGDRVPSENEVVREFAVSRPTARAALQELERRFLVRRKKGSGTFVNERIPYPVGGRHAASISQALALSGHRSELRIVTVTDVEPTQSEARSFGDDAPSRLWSIGRTISVDGDVVGFNVSRLSASLTPNVRRHLTGIPSIWRILDVHYGIRLVRRSIDVSIDTPPEHVARILDSREPAWHLRSVNVNESHGGVVELGESWFRTDRVAVTVRFDQSTEARSA